MTLVVFSLIFYVFLHVLSSLGRGEGPTNAPKPPLSPLATARPRSLRSSVRLSVAPLRCERFAKLDQRRPVETAMAKRKEDIGWIKTDQRAWGTFKVLIRVFILSFSKVFWLVPSHTFLKPIPFVKDCLF